MAFVTKGDNLEVIKKTKLETIPEVEEADNTDGKITEEEAQEIIIENEAEKFSTLIEKTFVEETEAIDSEDGIAQDILGKITLKIKEKIESTESNGFGLRLLRLMFMFIFLESVTRKDNSTDKSSSAA